MHRNQLIILGLCVLAGIGIVLWFGQDYSNEVRAFLRALRRML
jgi:hypothetical protein